MIRKKITKPGSVESLGCNKVAWTNLLWVGSMLRRLKSMNHKKVRYNYQSCVLIRQTAQITKNVQPYFSKQDPP